MSKVQIAPLCFPRSVSEPPKGPAPPVVVYARTAFGGDTKLASEISRVT
jgi:hypothetical protein